MRCAACGSDNEQGRGFCASCGADLRETCATCGFGNDPAATFCGGCGRRRVMPGLDEPPARAWPTAERRQLTLLFCDLCQSTALSDRLDPEDMREVLEAYRARCSAAFERYRGTVAYYMGDGILAYFGYPAAHEDDAVRAVRAALEIVPSIIALGRDWQPVLPLPLQVRISVHTGLVVAGEIGVDQRRSELWAVGRAPNVAARLQQLAAPNTIVISDATHRLLRGAFSVQSLGHHELAGIGDTIEAYRVEREQPIASASTIDAWLETVPLVNRDAEFAFLERCWQQARLGEGAAVLVSGEPGIGKSRLIRALVSSLRAADHHVLLLQGSPYFADSPLHPVIEYIERVAGIAASDSGERRLERLERLVGTLRQRLPDLVEVLADLLGIEQGRYNALAEVAPAERRLRILTNLSDYMLSTARERPTILVFEDLQWADPTTREWLGRLFGRLAEAPLLGLVALRSDFRPSWADQASIRHLAVERLDRDHSAAILDSLTTDFPLSAELRERVLGATDGIPLFVEEMTKALVEEEQTGTDVARSNLTAAGSTVPATIKDSLTARLDRLGDAKRVAQIAAVIGREFSRALLAQVTDIPAPELDASLARLEQSGLVLALTGTEDQFAFKHALVRDAAYDGLLHRVRRQLHGRIVEVLEAAFPSIVASNPELAAQHSTEARLYEKAVRHWLAAGRLAVARSAHPEAVSDLERALQCLRRLPDSAAWAAVRLECLVTLGPSLILIEGPGAQRVEVVYSDAVQLCERVEPSLDHVAAFWGWWRTSQDYDVLSDRAERLLGLAKRLAAPAVTLQAHHCMWATRLEMADFAGAWRHIEIGLDLYERGEFSGQADFFGGHDAKVCGFGNAALALWHMGQPERALRHSLSALEWGTQLGHAGTMLHALDTAVVFRRCRREWRAAGQLASRMIDLARQRGLRDHVAKGELYLGWSVASDGRLAEGIAMMQRAFAVERVAGTPEDFPIYADMLAEVLLQAGRVEEALREIEQAIAESEAGARLIWLPELHRRRGAALLAVGAPSDDAEASMSESLHMARNQNSLALELRAARSLAKLWWRQGRRDDARTLLATTHGRFAEGFDTPDLREVVADLEAMRVAAARTRTQV